MLVVSCVGDHFVADKGLDLWQCNGRALDTEARLQRHTEELIPIGIQDADVTASDDDCMEKKGYTFTGDPDPQFCTQDRIPQCYSGWRFR